MLQAIGAWRAGAVVLLLATAAAAGTPVRGQAPAMVRNGQPRAMHRRLEALVGTWDVEKRLFIAGGAPDKPLVSRDLVCRRGWVAGTGRRHLQDVTRGTLGGGAYHRLGILAYSTMDRRYEWNTVDAINTGMMTYKGVRGSATRPAGPIVMVGEFTDQGVLGDACAGKTVRQRTVIRVESSDRHVMELYFTPPGERERLVDRSVYTRRRSRGARE